jgi:hypothetical protein
VNWLKAMLLMVVLGAILYGVNLVLNKSAPVESPVGNGAWTGTDGSIGPPSVTSGTSGMNSPPGYSPPAYGQIPAGPASYGSGNSATTNPPTGYAPNGSYPPSPPPASPNPSGPNASQTTTVASAPIGGPSNAAPPADPTGNQAGGYQPATPQVVNSDPTHSSIPATPVGLVAGSQSTGSQPGTADKPGGGAAFATTMDSVNATLQEGKLADGLQQLTITLLRDGPQLNPEETQQLNDLLGRLAGTVVYSRQHLLLPPYEVKPGDRLETIASEFQIPVELLAKINGISDPDHLTPGDKLKVIRGPFMALVSLSKREVTLVVQRCYAGRFKLIGVGNDAAALNGDFKVDRKLLDLSQLKLQHPSTAQHWIDFRDGFGFCGLSDPTMVDDPHEITLSSHDAEDLFDILSVGSSISVR